MRSSRLTGLAALILVALCATYAAEPDLDEAMASLKIPPDWLAGVRTSYDTRQPWKKARLHIRKLLAQGKNREAIKLTYDYLIVRKVNKDTHEYPMYLYLGNEHAWAIKAYEERIKGGHRGVAHDCRGLASCYLAFGESEEAIETLRFGLKHLPDPPWGQMMEAGIHDHLGDIHARMEDQQQAEQHYRKSMALFKAAKPKYGRHQLPRRVAKVQTKIEIMKRTSFDLATVRDGIHRGQSMGYVQPLTCTVIVRGGRITNIRLHHKENIEQGATRIIPKRIVDAQSLDVDGITGATVTTQAIVEATYRALLKGGLK